MCVDDSRRFRRHRQKTPAPANKATTAAKAIHPTGKRSSGLSVVCRLGWSTDTVKPCDCPVGSVAWPPSSVAVGVNSGAGCVEAGAADGGTIAPPPDGTDVGAGTSPGGITGINSSRVAAGLSIAGGAWGAVPVAVGLAALAGILGASILTALSVDAGAGGQDATGRPGDIAPALAIPADTGPSAGRDSGATARSSGSASSATTFFDAPGDARQGSTSANKV
jgi:hypothetical protein